MKARFERWFIIMLIVLLTMIMVACTRPARPGADETPTPDPSVSGAVTGTVTADNTGVITSTIPADNTGVVTATTPTDGVATPEVPAAATATIGSEVVTGTTPTTGTEATATTAPVVASTAVTPTATTASGGSAAATPTPTPTATPPAPAATVAAAGTPPATEVTHVIQPGENLYRIGLQYGYSWAVLAQYNNITNPNYVVVGQTIKIPAAGTPPATPVPTEVLYTVRQGDTLGQIAAAFGVSWVQIAEANGLVNPNLIYPGQVLKVPSNTPGPTPQFTHVVQSGETIFLISLRYGVVWTDIAAANNIAAPYVIFPGQTLVIPGGN